jgi:hypothetical protein
MTLEGSGVFIEPGIRKIQDSVEEHTRFDTEHFPESGGAVYQVFPTGQGRPTS